MATVSNPKYSSKEFRCSITLIALKH